MPSQDVILTIRPQGLDSFRNRMKAALGGVQSDIRRINRQTATEQLRSINSQISSQRRLGQIQRQIDTRRGADGRFISRQKIVALRRERQQIISNSRVARLTSGRQLIALRAQKSAFRDLQKSTAGFRRALTGAKIAAIAIASVGLFLVVRRLKQAVSLGIDLNQKFEAMQIGVAAILAANSKVVDSLGRQLKGADAVFAAQSLSKKIVEDIFRITLKTGSTLEETLTAFRIAFPLVIRDIAVGQRDINNAIQETLQVVGAINLGARAVGLSSSLVAIQIDDILKGVITTRTLLAKALQIEQEELKVARERGNIVGFVLEKLKGFTVATDQILGTFGAINAQLVAIGQTIAKKVTETGFVRLRDVLKGLRDLLFSFNEETKKLEFPRRIQDAINSASRAFDSFVRLTIAATPTLIKAFGSVASVIQRLALGLTIIRLTQKETALFAQRVGAVGLILPQGERDRIEKDITSLRKISEALAQSILNTEDATKQAGLTVKGLLEDFEKGLGRVKKAAEQTGVRLASFPQKLTGKEFKKFFDDFKKDLDAIDRFNKKREEVLKLTRKSLAVPAKEAAERAGGLAKAFSAVFAKRLDLQRKFIRLTSSTEREARQRLFRFDLNLLQKQLELTKKLRLGDEAEILEKIRQLRTKFALDQREATKNAAQDLRDSVNQSLRELSEQIGESFSRIFENILSGTRSLAAAMRNILRSIAGSILATFFRRIITNAVDALLQSFRNRLSKIIGRGGILGKIISIILGVDPKAVKASKENTEALEKATEVTEDKLVPALTDLTDAIRGGAQGGVRNLLRGGLSGIALPFGAAAAGGGGIGALEKLLDSKLGKIAQVGAGLTQAIFGASKLSKISGALIAASAIPGPQAPFIALAGVITGLFGALSGKEKREAQRLKRVAEAIKRQTKELPKPKTFKFADAPSIRDIFGRTILEAPGRFLSVSASAPALAGGGLLPLPPGGPTRPIPPVGPTGGGGGAPRRLISINITANFNVSAVDADGVNRFFQQNASAIGDAVAGEIERRITRAVHLESRSGLSSAIREVVNPA